MELMTVLIGRLTVAAIFAGGAIWMISEGKDGWGWLIFAAILFGMASIETSSK